MNYQIKKWLPNILTLCRIVAGIFLLILFFTTNETTFFQVYLFSAIAVTDLLDGWLARKLKAISKWGQFLDPIADKVLLVGTFGYFYFLSVIHSWFFVLYTLRELVQVYFRIIVFAKNQTDNIPTLYVNKLKTALSYIYCIFLLLSRMVPAFRFDLFRPLNVFMELIILLLSYLGLFKLLFKK